MTPVVVRPTGGVATCYSVWRTSRATDVAICIGMKLLRCSGETLSGNADECAAGLVSRAARVPMGVVDDGVGDGEPGSSPPPERRDGDLPSLQGPVSGCRGDRGVETVVLV